MKKIRKKKIAKQTDFKIIIMKITSELTFIIKVCIVFDVKNEIKIVLCVKLLQIKMNLI